jgi:Fur family transcriptional regulator, ferric uptake regulator
MENLALKGEQRVRASGKRLTHQRRLLLRVLADAGCHLDAGEVYARAHQQDPHLSLATVYRTLSILKQTGAVRELRLEEQHHHYELDRQDGHFHLVCLGCGRVIEVDSTTFLEAARAVGQEFDFSVASAQVELTGTCAQCRSRA